MSMYAEVILDYYRHPRNYGKLNHPQIVSHDMNTSCGDEITMQVEVKDNMVADIRFSGKGCAISQAAASMLTEHVMGLSLGEVAKLNKETMLKLVPIDISPMRLKCALLGFKVLKLGVIKALDRGENHEN